MWLNVKDNGVGWLLCQASEFNSRRRPTLGYLVIERSAVMASHWSVRKLEAGRRSKRLLKATDSTRYMATRLQGPG